MTGGRFDWNEIRERTDLAGVATDLLGSAQRRSGSRLYWRCPFHDDRSPSFYVDTTRKTWYCWPCGIKGADAAELVKRHNRVPFLPRSGPVPRRTVRHRDRPGEKPRSETLAPYRRGGFRPQTWHAREGSRLPARTIVWPEPGRLPVPGQGRR